MNWSSFVEKNTRNKWQRDNLKQLPFIAAVMVFFFLIDILAYVVSEEESHELFSKLELLFYMEVTLIPYAAINAVFLVEVLFTDRVKSRFNLLLLKNLGVLVGVLVGTAITESVYAMNGIVDDDVISLGTVTIDPISTNFISYALLGLIISIPTFIRQTRRMELQLMLKEKELALKKEQQLKTKAQLEALQAKINPHFLYNSLNSIARLIYEDQKKAEKMVLLLSTLFRYSINTQERTYASVSEELEMVKTYLEIEKIRFDDRLTVEIEVEEDSRPYLIPRFLLQPLVENAIKHGVSSLPQGEIKLSIRLEDRALHMRLYDNGPDFPTHLNVGYGLKSIYDKLDLLFPDDYRVDVVNKPEKLIHIVIEKLITHAPRI